MTQKSWKEWLRKGEETYRKTGKRKRVSYELIARWVSACLEEIDVDLIRRSFVVTGIAASTVTNYHEQLRNVLDDTIGHVTAKKPAAVESSRPADRLFGQWRHQRNGIP